MTANSCGVCTTQLPMMIDPSLPEPRCAIFWDYEVGVLGSMPSQRPSADL